MYINIIINAVYYYIIVLLCDSSIYPYLGPLLHAM